MRRSLEPCLTRVQGRGPSKPGGRASLDAWYSCTALRMARGFPRYSNEGKKKVTAFLTHRPGLAVCDDCLRKLLAMSRTSLCEKDMADNAAAVGLIRERNVCILCGDERITTKARAES